LNACVHKDEGGRKSGLATAKAFLLARMPAAAEGIFNPSLSAKDRKSIRISNLRRWIADSFVEIGTETGQSVIFWFSEQIDDKCLAKQKKMLNNHNRLACAPDNISNHWTFNLSRNGHKSRSTCPCSPTPQRDCYTKIWGNIVKKSLWFSCMFLHYSF